VDRRHVQQLTLLLLAESFSPCPSLIYYS
jgi:hypothetical protein